MSYESAYIIGYLGTLFAAIVYLSGLQLVSTIVNGQAPEDFPFFPYIAMLASAAVWLKYGLLRENLPLITVNSIGVAVQLVIVGVYYCYARRKTNLQLQLGMCMLMVFPILSYVRYSPDIYLAIDHLGAYCTIMSIMSYGAPLSALVDVCRSKSTGSMSLSLSALNSVTASLWLTYGLLVNDANLAMPNCVGACLSCFQLLLFCIYPRHRPPERERTAAPLLYTV